MRPSCSRRLVATIRTIGDMIRTAPFWSSRENRSGISPLYCHSVSDTETSLASFEYAMSCFEAERAPSSLGDHVAPEMSPCSSSTTCTLKRTNTTTLKFSLSFVWMRRGRSAPRGPSASLRIVATAEEHVQRSLDLKAIQENVGAESWQLLPPLEQF